MKVAGVVLAAGSSSRLGEAKQTVALGGERLLERAVRIARAAGLAPIVVVLGCGADEVRLTCRLEEVQVVVNGGWSEGMGSSVRAGVSALGPTLNGLVLMTCDQPTVTSAHLRRLVDAGTTGVAATGHAVGSGYAGRIGVPAFFPVSRFGELLDLRGAEGARNLLRAEPSVELAGGELDVDTPQALAAARLQFP